MLSIDQCKQFVKEMFVFGSYEDFPVATIIDLLKAADEAYFNEEEDSTFMEDSQYDALKQYAQRLAPTDVYFTGVGSAIRGGKIKLPYSMGSLNQAYQGDFVRWVQKYDLSNHDVCISHKLDGVSIMAVYGPDGALQIAYSRGDGEQGADITRHISQVHNVPSVINTNGQTLTVRAEAIISPENFKYLQDKVKSRSGKPYKNPRNMMAGLMNASENNDIVYNYIDVIVYQIVGSDDGKIDQLQTISQLGFSVVQYNVYKAGTLNDDVLTQLLNTARSVTKYEIDGIVIEVCDAAKRASMVTSRDTLNPEYAVKFKVADASNYAVATVKGVEWNISKDGYYKPRVQIEPVNLVGVTIQNLTGFNAKFIKDNGIGPGAKIQITRSGDVIPYILGVVERVDPQLPDDPDVVWTETGVDMLLQDVSRNAIASFERLNDFFESIDVPHLGDGNLQKMFDMGFDAPEKIIPLNQEDISSLVGSPAIGKKIHKGMREKFTNIPLYVLMGSHHAFGRGVGVRKMKKLYEAFKGDMSLCTNHEAITAVEGFENKTATKIVSGYPVFVEFLESVKDYITIAEYQAKKEGPLTGKSFVFTGFRSKELEAAIVDAGGTMSSGVSRNTSFLVTAEPDSTSTKAVKARELGVTVIGQQQLRDML